MMDESAGDVGHVEKKSQDGPRRVKLRQLTLKSNQMDSWTLGKGH